MANPPSEEFLKQLDPQMLEVVNTILKTKSPPAGMYFKNPAEANKPFASPMYAESFKGLPSATIINAQCDVLADDGKAYAGKLEAAGVKVNHEVYKGVTHEFFGMGLAVDRAKAAETFAGNQLKRAFAGGSSKQE